MSHDRHMRHIKYMHRGGARDGGGAKGKVHGTYFFRTDNGFLLLLNRNEFFLEVGQAI